MREGTLYPYNSPVGAARGARGLGLSVRGDALHDHVQVGVTQ